MNRKKFVVVIVVLACIAGAYYAVAGGNPINTALSFFVNEPADSAAKNAATRQQEAARDADLMKAVRAHAEVLSGLGECYKNDPSAKNCIQFEKDASKEWKNALRNVLKEFSTEEEIAALAPKPAPAPAPVQQIVSKEVVYNALEELISVKGGSVSIPMAPQQIPVPVVAEELKPLQPIVPNAAPISEAPRTSKMSDVFTAPACEPVTLKGSSLIKFRKELEAKERAGKLSVAERCQIKAIRAGWRERKAAKVTGVAKPKN